MAGTSKTNKRGQQTTIIKVGANEAGKLPPQAQELEDSVLGALMIEKDAYSTVADLLRPEVFYKDQNRVVFEAIRELAAKDQPIEKWKENSWGGFTAGPPNSYGEYFQWLDESGSTDIIAVRDQTADWRTNDGWYTLDGRKLNARPTQKGIYINKGKKIVVK